MTAQEVAIIDPAKPELQASGLAQSQVEPKENLAERKRRAAPISAI